MRIGMMLVTALELINRFHRRQQPQQDGQSMRRWASIPVEVSYGSNRAITRSWFMLSTNSPKAKYVENQATAEVRPEALVLPDWDYAA